MDSDHIVSVEQEIATVKTNKPHVVVLGAGASRATCPDGEKNGKKLPLMKDFVDIVGLKTTLQRWGINPDQNFEEIFSDLYEKNENEKLSQIEKTVEGYFTQLRLPSVPTIYDHLVLSLREKDLIATFNWDPLLMHAYLRNKKSGLKLPQLSFLHGNVTVAYCEKDKITSIVGNKCQKCGEQFKRTPLLYPIKKKNYSDNSFILNEWKRLKWNFQNAFMITVFGYSGPKTDIEAISAMHEAWGSNETRQLEQTAFITTQKDDEVYENWKLFIHIIMK